MKLILSISAAIVMAGCAATYTPPISTTPDTSKSIAGSQMDLMRAAKQALIALGYQITNADNEAGVISTAYKDVRLTPTLADCGTTMGLDYLKDNRTSSKIGYGVIISPNKVTIKANMSATYLPGNDTQSITLTCISKGTLENELLSSIAAIISAY